MASGNFLVVGDRTTCNGKILSGDETMQWYGKAVVRQGDSVTCGKHSGTFVIVGGVTNTMTSGRNLAGTLDSCSSCPCRSKLITSIPNETYQK